MMTTTKPHATAATTSYSKHAPSTLTEGVRRIAYISRLHNLVHVQGLPEDVARRRARAFAQGYCAAKVASKPASPASASAALAA
jgi:hypothetical protein